MIFHSEVRKAENRYVKSVRKESFFCDSMSDLCCIYHVRHSKSLLHVNISEKRRFGIEENPLQFIK